MPQLRHNTITGECVIIAPHRSARPGSEQRRESEPAGANVAHHQSNCPFCPGNEEHIPPIILELNSTAHPWQTRVIPNKFPAVRRSGATPEPSSHRKNARPVASSQLANDLRPPHDAVASRQTPDRSWNDGGRLEGTPVHGHHEVIIESPRHNVDLADMSIESVETVLETYHRRYHEIRTSDASLLPILFRNRGARAGASLHHPHSQLIAVPIAPARLRQEDEGAAIYFAEHGRCPYCDQIEAEVTASSRIVTENAHFVAFVPYAAAGPFEIIISPLRHCPDFGDTTNVERRDLAKILLTAVRSLRTALDRPDYNYVIRSSVAYGASDPHLHWYLRIVPKLMQPGGFEVATGIPINPSSPEDDAERLRTCVTA